LDLKSFVIKDLSQAKFHQGLYTENCYVLVEGWYEDMVFHVIAMGHPPIELAEVTSFMRIFYNLFSVQKKLIITIKFGTSYLNF